MKKYFIFKNNKTSTSNIGTAIEVTTPTLAVVNTSPGFSAAGAYCYSTNCNKVTYVKSSSSLMQINMLALLGAVLFSFTF